MNTLMVASKTQGLRFDAQAAVAPLAIVEKLAQVVGQVLEAMRTVQTGAARLARA